MCVGTNEVGLVEIRNFGVQKMIEDILLSIHYHYCLVVTLIISIGPIVASSFSLPSYTSPFQQYSSRQAGRLVVVVVVVIVIVGIVVA